MLGRFIGASGFSNLADGVATVAWAWLATLLTRDPLLIAVVPFALRLPWFLFALPAGIVTDRVDRRRLILAADLLRMVAFLAAAMAIWAALPLPPAPERGLALAWLYWLILGVALTVGVAEVFRDNAAQTMLPALVADKSRLERANSRQWSVEMLGNALIGPALGALVIGWALPLPFVLNAACYALALVLVATIAGRFRPGDAAGPRHWRRELAEGFAFLRSQPLLRLLAVVTGLWNLIFQIAMVAMVLHAQENLGLDARGYGLVLASSAIGGIAGALTAERVIVRLGPGRTAQWCLLLPTFCFFGLAAAPNGWGLALAFGLVELPGMVWNVVSVSYRQRRIPNHLYGRVNSIYRLLAWGMIPLGTLMSGVITRLAETVLPRGPALIVPFLVAGAMSALIAVVAWRPLGRGFAIGR